MLIFFDSDRNSFILTFKSLYILCFYASDDNNTMMTNKRILNKTKITNSTMV